jgi:hypothetical protein
METESGLINFRGALLPELDFRGVVFGLEVVEDTGVVEGVEAPKVRGEDVAEAGEAAGVAGVAEIVEFVLFAESLRLRPVATGISSGVGFSSERGLTLGIPSGVADPA